MKNPIRSVVPVAYSGLLGDVSKLLEAACRASARTVSALMTATYWEVGHRIVEFEQGGEKRVEYGEKVLTCLAEDLTTRFGRGFSRFNLGRFRHFYLATSVGQIRAILSLESRDGQKRTPVSLKSAEATTAQTSFAQFRLPDLARAFPLPWSHYVLLINRTRSPECFDFYHTEDLPDGWSVPKLLNELNEVLAA